jgi:hypothetical protein
VSHHGSATEAQRAAQSLARTGTTIAVVLHDRDSSEIRQEALDESRTIKEKAQAGSIDTLLALPGGCASVDAAAICVVGRAGCLGSVLGDDEHRSVAMLDYAPRHASEQAGAQP